MQGWTTRRILKEAFKDRIPREVIERRKTGLPVPLLRWMRDDLGTVVREVLLSDASLGRGYFRKSALERLLDRNDVDGTFSKEVFSLLTLELWHREFVDANRTPCPQSAAN